MFRDKKAAERLEEDVFQLRRRVDDLESGAKRLGLEWEELYDKVRRQMARMSKRIAVDAASPPTGNGEEPASSTYLSTDPISAKILKRRGARMGDK